MRKLIYVLVVCFLISPLLHAKFEKSIDYYGGYNAGGYTLWQTVEIYEKGMSQTPANDVLKNNCSANEQMGELSLSSNGNNYTSILYVDNYRKFPLERNKTYTAVISTSIFASPADISTIINAWPTFTVLLEYAKYYLSTTNGENFALTGESQIYYSQSNNVGYICYIDFKVADSNFSIDSGNEVHAGTSTLSFKTLWGQSDKLFDTFTQLTPAIVGPTEDEVPIQSTSYTPSMPMMVLHDPPGDQSYASMSSGTEYCTTVGWSAKENSTLGGWASVKVGAKGSVGFLGIVETDYEVYAQATGSMQMSMETNSAGETTRCLKTTSTFSTSQDDITGKRGDVFIGKATELSFGLYEIAEFDCVNPTISKKLVMAPTGVSTEFAYTEDFIRNTLIPQLENTLAQNPNDKTAQRQLSVWQQALAQNDAVYNGSTITTKDFTAGASQSYSQESTVSTINTIETSVDISQGLAIEAGIEVGGVGASGGVSIDLRTSTGSSSSNNSINTNDISYFLGDNDAAGIGGDKFVVKVLNDSKYGTPAFLLQDAGSQTSCPYEGGYQIDQPELHFQNGDKSRTFNGPVGEAIVIPIEICNESQYERDYYLKSNNAENPNGLNMNVAGTVLNSTSTGHAFSIAPNTCISQNMIVTSLAPSTLTTFENVELYLEACSNDATQGNEPIVSAILMNVYFGDPPPLDFSYTCGALNLSIDGTQHGPFSNVDGNVESGEEAIAPPGGDCTSQEAWCTDANTIDNSVWFTFTAPETGKIEISTCDLADFDTQIAVYSVGECGNFGSYALVAANDDGPETCSTDYDSFLSLENLTPGQIYYLLVDGYGGAFGNFYVQLTTLGGVGFENIAKNVHLEIYPNPCSDKIEVVSDELFTSFTLYDITGKQVFQEAISNFSTQLTIDLPELSNGIYMGKFTNDKLSQYTKIQIIH
ncbi:MAG: T9SS type A sorting domain-containing protein [Chitinophagales bacterium]|nr:T9SS type A sorting domain-containing protein [Bacteroidota bacterium]MCB9044388.1 T9SS type A sorting domain-containing protein [Chitinophagales bacterium]